MSWFFCLPFVVCTGDGVRLLGLILIGPGRKFICQKGMIESKAVMKINVLNIFIFLSNTFVFIIVMLFLRFGEDSSFRNRKNPLLNLDGLVNQVFT